MLEIERRSWARIRRPVRVFISDPEDALNEPYTGWILDYSPGGVCLSFNREGIEEGATLVVQPTSAPVHVELKVTNRRQQANRLELGCEFSRCLDWEKSLLLGL